MRRIVVVLTLAVFGTWGLGGAAFGQPRDRPGRVFPEWRPESGRGESALAEELLTLVRTGRRDKTASVEFMDALEEFWKNPSGCFKMSTLASPLQCKEAIVRCSSAQSEGLRVMLPAVPSALTKCPNISSEATG